MPRNEHEHVAQTMLFRWIDQQAETNEDYANIFAIPNGGERNAVVAGKLKDEGVRAGVPDIFVAVPRMYNIPGPNGSPLAVPRMGMFVEMKIKPNKVKPHQQAWLDRLDRAGYYVMVCWSYEEAKQEIARYLGTL